MQSKIVTEFSPQTSDEPTDEREPEQADWLASLGHVNSRPRYPDRSCRLARRANKFQAGFWCVAVVY
jgi:hypothetical protein